MKHTRGSWKIITPADRKMAGDDSYGIAGPRTGNPSRSVCFADVEGETPEEAAANAALICAAPDLLEVLKTTAGNIESLRAAKVCNTYDNWLETVNAAIAKAEGKK